MATPTNAEEPLIETVTDPSDFAQIFHCTSDAFGRQARDAVWMVCNPNWDSEKGQELGAIHFTARWKHIKTNKFGQPNTIFLKASLPDPADETERRIVGMAIWEQCSFVDGYGNKPSDDMTEAVATLEPTEGRFATQIFRSLYKRRISYAKEKESTDSPAIFVLDMCAVDPEFQRRGIAQKLVQWGLDEAKRRGNLECTTEASSMGRGAYMKLGFRDERVGDIVYELENEFKTRDTPPNVFLRTGTTQS
jgi:ribosomal protein S18 acetylase RimI-like enzyme